MEIKVASLPKTIVVGITTFIRENDDPEYYNVNGRSYFERIHILSFPEDVLKQIGIKWK